ncbi:uncharacterized protein LOC119766237 [Culex quinquefasciatus]|uniref:uncharacterized protein LOC119766237 n=1 Tax=Culex quinquefasciatus TaxID=7176 RepID=UPI0018E2C588|nr:uncharacterized protein LOC119766237 [Culex quinquefasciatus]
MLKNSKITIEGSDAPQASDQEECPVETAESGGTTRQPALVVPVVAIANQPETAVNGPLIVKNAPVYQFAKTGAGQKTVGTYKRSLSEEKILGDPKRVRTGPIERMITPKLPPIPGRNRRKPRTIDSDAIRERAHVVLSDLLPEGSKTNVYYTLEEVAKLNEHIRSAGNIRSDITRSGLSLTVLVRQAEELWKEMRSKYNILAEEASTEKAARLLLEDRVKALEVHNDSHSSIEVEDQVTHSEFNSLREQNAALQAKVEELSKTIAELAAAKPASTPAALDRHHLRLAKAQQEILILREELKGLKEEKAKWESNPKPGKSGKTGKNKGKNNGKNQQNQKPKQVKGGVQNADPKPTVPITPSGSKDVGTIPDGESKGDNSGDESGDGTANDGFTVVNRRKPRSKHKPRTRNEAIAIKADEKSYASLLRNLRSNEEFKELGEATKSVRRTRQNELLLILKKGTKPSSEYARLVTESVGSDEIKVRSLCSETTLQCKNLDETVTAEDLLDAITTQCLTGTLSVPVQLRKYNQGTQTATFKLPAKIAAMVLKVGKIKVNWSVCPVSAIERPTVCFKCLEYGHKSWSCKGPDRTATVQVIQLNLNHCDTAQQLLFQTVVEKKCDIALLSEPYQVPEGNRNWLSDPPKAAAIWVTGQFPIQELVAAEEGFVIAKVNGVFYCSCYAPPRWSIDRFDRMLDRLTDALTGKTPVVVAGDFNAWSTQWGSRESNRRGQDLLEALARLNVDLANEGFTSTFRRNGVSSIVDVTFCSPSLMASMDWKVDEGYTHSDHQAVTFRICRVARGPAQPASRQECRWKTSTLNKEVFVEALRRESATRDILELDCDGLMTILTGTSDAAMLRQSKPRNARSPVYWWNEDIAAIRAASLSARRKLQRARSDELREARRVIYKIAKATLSKAIKESKRNCFGNLCQEANNAPWGNAYRIVMAKLKSGAVAIDRSPEMMSRIIDGLFPHHEVEPWPTTPYYHEGLTVDEQNITNEELIKAASALKANKAPGPDGIPNQVLKLAIEENLDMFRSALQKCMDTGVFPDRWKRQRLVLLPKPGKPPGDPSAYRPICLIDTAGKLLERVILNRLTIYLERGLSDRQFGFRKGRSTVDAIKAVLEKAKIAVEPKRRGMRFCAIITLDVKNAFNSASWDAIARSLHRFRVPNYLCKLLKSYFENRVLLYETDEGLRELIITAGVPQGSLIGPGLWNGMYDGVLTLELPTGVSIVGFADDIVLMVLGTVETVEHVVFECPRFQSSRETLLLGCGPDTSPDNLTDRMCQSEEAWGAASTAITQIMLKLQEKWRTDQRASRNEGPLAQ